MFKTLFDVFYIKSYLLLSQLQPVTVEESEIKSLADPSAKIDLLTQQLDFLEKVYDKLIKASEFYINQSSNYSRNLLTFLGIITTITISISTFIYNKTLQDARKQIKENVEAEVKKTIGQEISIQKEIVTKTLQKELAVNEVEVIYILSENVQSSPREVALLEERGFNITTVSPTNTTNLEHKIVVIDLYNRTAEMPQEKIDLALQTISTKFPINSILIIYLEMFSKQLETLKKSRQVEFYSIANNRVSLMGALVDAAYVLKSLRGQEKKM